MLPNLADDGNFLSHFSPVVEGELDGVASLFGVRAGGDGEELCAFRDGAPFF